MKKEIFRTLPVLSQEISLMFYLMDHNDHLEYYKSQKALLDKYPIDLLLKDVFKEEYSYDRLNTMYHQYICGESNEGFSVPRKASKRSYVEVCGENILIYIMFKKTKICGAPLFPWNYPEVICPLGKSRGYSPNQIFKDYKTLSTPLFYSKYVYGTQDSVHLKKPVANKELASFVCNSYEIPLYNFQLYVISDSLGVGIDAHAVFLFQIESGSVVMDSMLYITSTWYYTDKQILRDLLSLSIAKFGEKYKARWFMPGE